MHEPLNRCPLAGGDASFRVAQMDAKGKGITRAAQTTLVRIPKGTQPFLSCPRLDSLRFMQCDGEGVTVVGSRFGTSAAVAEGEGENQQCKQPIMIIEGEASARGKIYQSTTRTLYKG
jgi:hypothetical protein